MIGASLPWLRPMQFVAKVELFEKRWQGWLLNRLGAYPVRRGKADDEVMITSREVLDRGGVVCIFPEGTRIRSGSLGRPKRGFGRIALETGAAVLPVTVHGTEHVRRGWRIRPRKVEGADRPRAHLPADRGSVAGARRTRSARGSGPSSSCSGNGWVACRRCARPP